MRTTFDGRSALVTGGGSGIGLALARRLVSMGAHVVIADIDDDAVQTAADLLTESSHGHAGTVTARQLDVRDRLAFTTVVDEVTARHGQLDLLFNNAGISMGGPTEELTAEHWDRIIDVNLRGVVNGILAAYPKMIERRQGHIINTASGAGLAAPPFVTAYATTKHAIVGLSTGLRPEAARHGIAVTVLCPGAVDTPILDRRPPDDLPPTASATVTARQYLQLVRQTPMNADDYARRALRAIGRNRAIVVTPRRAAGLWYLHRISPAITDRLCTVVARRVSEQLISPAGSPPQAVSRRPGSA